MKKFIMTLFPWLLTGCLGYPPNIEPVKDFELTRYLGKWYELARLDHSFERGLENVSAEYSLREDGGLNVKNRGYSVAEGQWREATGKAFFVRSSTEGYLKVSFFGPFYGSYVIFALDKENYQYAFVTSSNHSYLWFLSRTPTVSDATKEQFTKTAERLKFNTKEIIWVNQNQPLRQ